MSSAAVQAMRPRALALLETWARATEENWHPVDDAPSLGSYGPGYVGWGVQTNWNYAGAMATLAASVPGVTAARWRERAMAALRFNLATHVTGGRPGHDGKLWGHTWISMLGIERALHGILPLADQLPDSDQAALRHMLISEADWVLHHAKRSKIEGVTAGVWAGDGRNHPESNIWWGCLLWRVAQLYPDATQAAEWKERAHVCLMNGISVDADAQDMTLIHGRPVSAWHVGANFFPHYALDHHGYLNVGYMIICLSNAAILHFDLKRAGLPVPDALYHHQRDLWEVVRRMIFSDGRLARIGGDSRVRYAYCQEYLLPTLLYAADRFGDDQALPLAERLLALIEQDAGNGSVGLYGHRLDALRLTNPHYFTRLHADRAAVLAMLANHLPVVQPPPPPANPIEVSLSGAWVEPAHGAVLHRSPTRLASFSWRAYGLTQALCLPPDDGSLAEWSLNLCPVVRFLGDDGLQAAKHRRLLDQHITPFDGGFVTSGRVVEGVSVVVDEGASCTDQAITHIAFAALPDGVTCLGLHYVVSAADRVGYLVELKDLHLGVPNDVFNGGCRTVHTSSGPTVLQSPSMRDEVIECESPWLNIDDRLGVVVLHGDRTLRIARSTQRRGGRYRSLYVEDICGQVINTVTRCRPGSLLADAGFAVLSGVTAPATAAVQGGSLSFTQPTVRGVWIQGQDGHRYALAANFGSTDTAVELFDRSVPIPASGAVVRRG